MALPRLKAVLPRIHDAMQPACNFTGVINRQLRENAFGCSPPHFICWTLDSDLPAEPKPHAFAGFGSLDSAELSSQKNDHDMQRRVSSLSHLTTTG